MFVCFVQHVCVCARANIKMQWEVACEKFQDLYSTPATQFSIISTKYTIVTVSSIQYIATSL